MTLNQAISKAQRQAKDAKEERFIVYEEGYTVVDQEHLDIFYPDMDVIESINEFGDIDP